MAVHVKESLTCGPGDCLQGGVVDAPGADPYWELGGPTCLTNTVMVCRACHRLVHHAGWDIQLVDGRPEFYPPPWIDQERRARRRPPHLPDAA
jgi:hypothetical protein